MNRRILLKGIAGLAAGALILPPTLDENVEATRRYWALDRTMMSMTKPSDWNIVLRGPEQLGMYGWQAAAWRDRPDLPLGSWEGRPFVRREQHVTPIVWEPGIISSGYVRGEEVALKILADLVANH